MSHRFSRAVAAAASLVLAAVIGTAVPVSASDARMPEIEETTTSLTDTGPQVRSIQHATASRVFAQTHAQFGAFGSVFLPSADGVPARAVVVSGYTGVVPMVDLPSGKATVLPITGLNGVTSVAAAPGATSAQGRLFLVEPFSNNVAVFDIASHSFVDDIPVPGAQPSKVAFVGSESGETGTVFVGADTDNTIVGIDVASGETVTTLRDPRGWIGSIAPGADASPTSGSLLVLDDGPFGQVLRIDIATGNVIDTYQVLTPGDPNRRTLEVISGSTSGTETLLVADRGSREVLTYDVASRSVKAKYRYGQSGSSLGPSAASYVPGDAPGEGALLAFLESGDFALLDEATGDLVFEVTSLGYPTGGVGFRASEEGSVDGEVFVAERLTGGIKVYDTATGTVTRQFDVSRDDDHFPRLAMGGDSSHLLAVGWEKGPLQIRDPDTGAAVRSFGLWASAIGAIPETSEFLISSRKTLTLVDAASGAVQPPLSLDITPGASTRGIWNGASVYFVPDSAGTTVQVRSVDDFTLLTTFDGFRKPAYVALLSPEQLIVQEAGGVYRVVDLRTGDVILAVRSGFRAAGVTAVADPVAGGARIYTSDSTMGIGITIVDGVTLAPDSVPDGLVGDRFEFEFEAHGSPLPALTVTGVLPPGLELDLGTGVMSGVPTEAGQFTFTVTAGNGTSPDVSREYSMTIGAIPALTTKTLPDAVRDAEYSTRVEAAGFPGPSFEVADGALPDGLTLDPHTGAISGTPTASGAFALTVRARNVFGVDEREYTITVASSGTAPDLGAGDGQGGDELTPEAPSDGALAVTGGIAQGALAALGVLALASGALSLASRSGRMRGRVTANASSIDGI